MQLTKLHPHFDRLQQQYGDKSLSAIYWAGCIEKPKVCFVFMNPTGRNVSAQPEWEGIRAPWLGFKQVWKLFFELDLISKELYLQTQGSAIGRTPDFVEKLFGELANKRVYVTNLAKCTQADAAALRNNVFREYLELMHQEIEMLQPENIITFGNQVTSILADKNVSVSNYENIDQHEKLIIGNQTYKIYPCRYPVGMGYRNKDKAMERIRSIL